jgi:hypothetical protein
VIRICLPRLVLRWLRLAWPAWLVVSAGGDAIAKSFCGKPRAGVSEKGHDGGPAATYIALSSQEGLAEGPSTLPPKLRSCRYFDITYRAELKILYLWDC